MILPRTMRAARYPTSGPEAGRLRLDVIDRPEPAPGEVLVEVAVSGVNPTDWKTRTGIGTLSRAPWVIPHHDGAGVIVEIGRASCRERV